MLNDELLDYLFDGQSHLFVQPMAKWVESSRRFTTFVTAFRDKIRKKIRTTQDQESLLDLRLELETAYLLLQERSLSLGYEPQLAERVRAPDFSVTYTTSYTFMVEVTRQRADPRIFQAETLEQLQEISAPETAQAFPPLAERLTDTICSKLGQFLSQRSNVLIIGVETLAQSPSDLRAIMLRIQQRAERNDSAFMQRYRFRDRTEFFHSYLRLSEILVRGQDWRAADQAIGWINPQAKHPLPNKVRTALYRSHAVEK